MRINKENYEAWFLDFAEGTLSDSQIEELNEFLSMNPELKAELDAFEIIPLQPDLSVVFENKASLRRNARIISFIYKPMLRYAAAAIVILTIGYSITRFLPGTELTKEARKYTPTTISPNLSEVKPGIKTPVDNNNKNENEIEIKLPTHFNNQIANQVNQNQNPSREERENDFVVVASNPMMSKGIRTIGFNNLRNLQDEVFPGKYSVPSYAFDHPYIDEKNKGFLNMLAMNVPRGFVPEMIAEDMKEQNTESKPLSFQVPNAPKKLFDSIFKN